MTRLGQDVIKEIIRVYHRGEDPVMFQNIGGVAAASASRPAAINLVKKRGLPLMRYRQTVEERLRSWIINETHDTCNRETSYTVDTVGTIRTEDIISIIGT